MSHYLTISCGIIQSTKHLDQESIMNALEEAEGDSDDNVAHFCAKLTPQVERASLYLKIGEVRNAMAVLAAVGEPFVQMLASQLDNLPEEDTPEHSTIHSFIAELETQWYNASKEFPATLEKEAKEKAKRELEKKDKEEAEGKTDGFAKPKPKSKPNVGKKGKKGGAAEEEEEDDDDMAFMYMPTITSPINLEQLFSLLAGWRTALESKFGPLFGDALRVVKKAILKTKEGTQTAGSTSAKSKTTQGGETSKRKLAEVSNTEGRKDEESKPTKKAKQT